MRKSILGIIAITFLLFTSCEHEKLDPYTKSVNKQRFSKDSVLKWDSQSPFNGQDKIDFVQLQYYKPDKTYLVEADLEKFAATDTFLMENTVGKKEKYFRFGKLKFNLKGKPTELVVYQQQRLLKEGGYENHLFLPFWDETNGEETYHGGRYIDLQYEGKDKITVDFNFAYNPYCAYSEEYTCPVPPEENRLPFIVEAGEKIYKNETLLK